MWIGILKKTGKEIAKSIARSTVIGAASDTLIAVASKRNVTKEVVCGTVSAATGALVKEGVEHFIKATGPAGLIAGVSASIVTRYAVRRTIEGAKVVDFNDDDEVMDGSVKQKTGKDSR